MIQPRPIGRVTVLVGESGGRYPHGNSLLVRGAEETVLIDPSLSLADGAPLGARVDRVLNSHCHEDHVAANFRFPDVPWCVHTADAAGMRSLDGLMAIYGMDEPVAEAAFRRTVVEHFHFTPRPDPTPFGDGHIFDLGGVRVRALHTPGHTRGHTCFHVEPDDVLYLGDIDLSSFGPYYGDAWSSLEDFERTLTLVRGIEARWYATFHHIGVLDGRAAFLERLDRFAAVIGGREERLLAFLVEPRSLDEIAAHRFVYRPADAVPYAGPVERRSMAQHIERLTASGRVVEVERGRWRAR